MIRFLLRRLAASLLLLYLVLTATFFLVHLAPGSPANLLAEDRRVSAEQKENLKRLYGLDRPLPEQFASYMIGLAKGDLGESIRTRRSVSTDLKQYLPATLERICTREATLSELPDVFDKMLAGGSFGRTLVRLPS